MTSHRRFPAFQRQPRQRTSLRGPASFVFVSSFPPPQKTILPKLRIRSVSGNQNSRSFMPFRDSPEYMDRLIIRVVLKHQNTGAFGIHRVVLDDDRMADSLNDVPCHQSISGEFIIPVVRNSQFPAPDPLPNKFKRLAHEPSLRFSLSLPKLKSGPLSSRHNRARSYCVHCPAGQGLLQAPAVLYAANSFASVSSSARW